MALTDTVNALIRQGVVRKTSRFTRLVLQYPDTVALPHNEHNGIPYIASTEILRNVTDYTVQEQDTLTAASLTLEAANDTLGTFTQMIRGNDLLRVEERYSDGASLNTDWILVGTFLVDNIEPSATSKSNQIRITGRDALKWLTLDGLEERFWADVIRYLKPMRQLKRKVDPDLTDKNVYIYVDGEYNSQEQRWIHTVNWSDRPLPRLYDEKKRRLSGNDGAIQILYGTGEVIIDKEYFQSSFEEGGLNKPSQIHAQYARFCGPEDELEATAVLATSDRIVLPSQVTRYREINGVRTPYTEVYTPDDSVAGMTVVVLDGRAKGTRFYVKRLYPFSRTLIVDRNVNADGLQTGDLIRLGEANRMESVVERLFLAAGFQNSDPDKPFYIAQIDQTVPQLTLPTVEDFDYRGLRRSDFMSAYQRMRELMPPYLQLYAGPDTSVYHVNTFQRNEPIFSVTDAVIDNSAELSDAEMITRVVYRVRDRSRRDLCSDERKAVVNFSAGLTIAEKYRELYPKKIRGMRRALFDRKGSTGIRIIDRNAPSLNKTYLDDKVLFTVEFDREYRMGEVHLRTTPYQYGESGDQWWQVEYSLEGEFWEILGDEFALTDGPMILTAGDFGDNIYAKFLRVRLNTPSKFQTEDVDPKAELEPEAPPTEPGETPTTTRFVMYAALATFAVYEYDVVEAEAELGLDRFDFYGVVEGVSGTQIIANVEGDPSWVGKLLYANNTSFTINIVDGNHLYLSKAPGSYGVEAGSTFTVIGGQSNADFERDLERRQRLGRRTHVVEQIDEVGYYIVQGMINQGFDYSLQQYAKDKAIEHLSELSRESFPVQIKTIRPDLRLRDTVAADLQRLGFFGNVYVRQLSRSADGTVSFRATPFRDVAVNTGTTQSTLSTTHSPTESTTEPETTVTTTPPDSSTTTPPTITTTQHVGP